jgi:hypothetical protein
MVTIPQVSVKYSKISGAHNFMRTTIILIGINLQRHRLGRLHQALAYLIPFLDQQAYQP